jgi:carbamoyltransferase
MAKNHIYVLGINAYDHDVSACLLRDGEIAYAISKERLSRDKHDGGFFGSVVDYCIEAEGITLDDIDLVVRNCYVLPVEEMEMRMVHEDVPEILDADGRNEATRHPYYLSTSSKVVTISHHLAHAYSAFAVSPFADGAVMVTDGVGSYCSDVTESYPAADKAHPLARESESYYAFNGTKLETVRKVWMGPSRGFLADEFFNMEGLGALYSRVSSYIFGDWNKCGEVMGLAPYGRANAIKPTLKFENGQLEVPQWDSTFNRPFLANSDEDWDKSASKPHWEDLAWRAQDDTEKVLIARAIWLRQTTGAKHLTIAGGVGLNCVANGRILREAGYDDVWIQPAAGDDGIAIGCAYYGHLAILNKPRTFVQKHAFLGKVYGSEDFEAATRQTLIRLRVNIKRSDDICAETASLLSQGNIFGWFQGGSEFGPRALGNRSILADARNPDMKDILNSRVKFRQPFRPFAPLVLIERADEIFEGEGESPFMLLVKAVRPEWRDRIPAIVHVDGTARIQTVREETNPRLYRLLQEFDRLTGVPVLLNTSFNIKGEPIVETPADAVDCFLGTGMDYLAMHDLLIAKSGLQRMMAPIGKAFWEGVRKGAARREKDTKPERKPRARTGR